ncbi:twin-arginine translocation signal domain-containing protein [Nanohaloarchaea archaeon]|nr:twin-arginine translocation signal domain-containing protein [Candidatus Nanohaloarchaea archaeon]
MGAGVWLGKALKSVRHNICGIGAVGLKEENVEEAVREVLEEEFEGEFSEERVERLKRKVRDRYEKREAVDAARDEVEDDVTRRKFLKTLGLGAGGLALSSPVAGQFFSVNEAAGGADTLSEVLSEGNDAGGNDIDMSQNNLLNVSQVNGQAVQDLGTSTLSEVLSEGNDIGGSSIVDGDVTVYDATSEQIGDSVVEEGITKTVQGYADLDTSSSLGSREFVYVSSENDVVVPVTGISDGGSETYASVLTGRVVAPALLVREGSVTGPGNIGSGIAFSISADIQNTKNSSDTQTIELVQGDGTTVKSKSVTIASGNTKTVTFSNLTVNNTGEFDFEVRTSRTGAGVPVTVKSATFLVSNISTNPQDVQDNEQYTISADINNIEPNVQGSQTINFVREGTVQKSQTLGLLGGGSSTVSFTDTIDTPSTGGSFQPSINSADDSAKTDITIQAADFQVQNLATPSTATDGNTITISADIQNTGDAEATKTVEVVRNGTGQGTTTQVTLAGSSSTTVQLNHTINTDVADNDIGLQTPDDTNTNPITVRAVFQVQNLATPSTATDGNSFTITADIQNTSSFQDTKTVEVIENGTGQGTTTQVTLTGSSSTTVQLNHTINTSTAGDFNIGLQTPDDTNTNPVTIPPANLQIQSTTPSATIATNDAYNINAEIQNTGGVDATKTVEISQGGSTEDSQSITLTNGETQTVTLTDTNGISSTGNETVTTSTPDDTQNTTVAVSDGTTVEKNVNDGGLHRIHAFESTGTNNLEVNNSTNVDVLVVGGGGSGGPKIGGGGGAGGLVYKSNISVTGGSFSINVGKGAPRLQPSGNIDYSESSHGNDSSAFGLTAKRGGLGGSHRGKDNDENDTDGTNGGSGGGAGESYDRGTNPGNATQPGTNPNADIDAGNIGGFPTSSSGDSGDFPRRSAGGGGAGEVGQEESYGGTDATGGDGIDMSNQFGTSFGESGVFAGGGGGFYYEDSGISFSQYEGGLGGGGNAADNVAANVSNDGGNAQPNTGGGGGGGSWQASQGGAGGSGIVLIRYPI